MGGPLILLNVIACVGVGLEEVVAGADLDPALLQ